MKKTVFLTLFALSLSVFFGACSDSGKKSDLAQELAAKQLVLEVKLLVKQGKIEEAGKAMARLEKEFGHTKTYTEEKVGLMRQGIAPQDQRFSITGKRLVELENALLSFRAESGEWPAPGQIHKPLDGWNNETYWIPGTPRTSYDLLVVSAGPDGKPGSGDELMIVWAEEDLGGYKDKKTGKMVGKTKKTRKKKKRKKKKEAPRVMTLDELRASEKAAGTPLEDIVSLEQLAAIGEKSKKAGQPRKGEMVMSLDEIREKL